MSVEEVDAFLESVFPEMHQGGRIFSTDAITEEGARVSMVPQARHLRPGGTVSGPTLMTLVDIAAYVAVLGHRGPKALAVTTNLSINFLRRPPLGPLTCTARILKNGQKLVVLDAAVEGEGTPPVLVAHATATYAMPPDGKDA
ncbi:MAG: PaaI family thioesterase [Hyphomicrobiaceae bacterium]|nr:PaaI family thioesterase [Hyphomicrobiaceae bacterium]